MAISAVVLVGLACGNSGLKSNAHDAGAASGGQAGSTISSRATGGTGGTIGLGGGGSIGGTGGTIGSGGAGGTSIGGTGGTIAFGGAGGSIIGGTAGTGGKGGTAGSPPSQGGCSAISMCYSGQMVDYQSGQRDLSGECPAERKCYSLYSGCFTTLCVLPDYGTDAGVDAGASDAGVDSAAADAGASDLRVDTGADGGATPRCGDGILDQGEMCDLGPLNGVCLDNQGNPVSGGLSCWVYCSRDCTIPIGDI